MTDKKQYLSLFWVYSLVLFVSTIWLFAPAGSFEFLNIDDGTYIIGNPHVGGEFTAETWKFAWTSNRASNWHPLTWFSHILDGIFYGKDPGGHHWTNILLHAFNGWLAFLCFIRLFDNKKESLGPHFFLGAAAVMGGIFAWHPLRVESVAWVSERKDLLCGFFWFTTLLMYLSYGREGGKKRYVLVMVSLMLALLSKPMAVTLPCVFLLLDFWPLNRFSKLKAENKHAGGLVAEKIPFFIIVGISCLFTVWAQQEGGAIQSAEEFPLFGRVTQMLYNYTGYLRKMIWPGILANFYPYPLSASSVIGWSSCLILLVIISAGVFIGRRGKPYAFVGWCWYLGTLLPVIGLVQVGLQASADRYTYLPGIGILVIFLGGLYTLSFSWIRKYFFWPSLFLIFFMVLFQPTRGYLSKWKDSQTLFGHAIEVTESNYVAHYNFAATLVKEGKLNEALEHCLIVQEINPSMMATDRMLSTIYLDMKQPMDALPILEKRWSEYGVSYYDCINLGAAYINLKRYDEAISVFEQGVKEGVADFSVWFNLGYSYFCKKNPELAISYFKKTKELKPDFYRADYYLALTYLNTGQWKLFNDVYVKLQLDAPKMALKLKQIAQRKQQK